MRRLHSAGTPFLSHSGGLLVFNLSIFPVNLISLIVVHVYHHAIIRINISFGYKFKFAPSVLHSKGIVLLIRFWLYEFPNSLFVSFNRKANQNVMWIQRYEFLLVHFKSKVPDLGKSGPWQFHLDRETWRKRKVENEQFVNRIEWISRGWPYSSLNNYFDILLI